MHRKRKQGFTLVEMMIVVAILGILTSIALPLYRNYIASARTAEAKSNLETLRVLQEQEFQDKGMYIDGSNTATLAAKIPGFQPGDPSELYYEYSVDTDVSSFTATATQKNKTSVKYTIDQDNNRGGPW